MTEKDSQSLALLNIGNLVPRENSISKPKPTLAYMRFLFLEIDIKMKR